MDIYARCDFVLTHFYEYIYCAETWQVVRNIYDAGT